MTKNLPEKIMHALQLVQVPRIIASGWNCGAFSGQWSARLLPDSHQRISWPRLASPLPPSTSHFSSRQYRSRTRSSHLKISQRVRSQITEIQPDPTRGPLQFIGKLFSYSAIQLFIHSTSISALVCIFMHLKTIVLIQLLLFWDW